MPANEQPVVEEQSPPAAAGPLPTLRLAMIAPDPASRNGIGRYSARLVEELRRQAPGARLLAPAGLLSGKPLPAGSDWRGRELPPGWPELFLTAIDADPPQLVHVQHGLYIGHGSELARFLSGLNARNIPCVMTLHGVWPPTAMRRWPKRFYRLLAAEVRRVVVHQRAGSLALLQRHGIAAGRIAVIPHGTWTGAEAAPPGVPAAVQAQGRKIVLFAGNIFRRKGLHVVVRAFPAVVKKIPGACLAIVGEERGNNLLDRLYRLWLRARMRRGLREGWILRRPGYADDAEFSSWIAAASVAVFPYLRRYGSASGVFHRALAAGRPALCSHVPTFAEAADAWGGRLPGLVLPPGDARAWSRGLVRLLADDALRRQAAQASLELGRATSWAVVARQHLEMYRSLLRPAPGAGIASLDPL